MPDTKNILQTEEFTADGKSKDNATESPSDAPWIQPEIETDEELEAAGEELSRYADDLKDPNGPYMAIRKRMEMYGLRADEISEANEKRQDEIKERMETYWRKRGPELEKKVGKLAFATVRLTRRKYCIGITDLKACIEWCKQFAPALVVEKVKTTEDVDKGKLQTLILQNHDTDLEVAGAERVQDHSFTVKVNAPLSEESDG